MRRKKLTPTIQTHHLRESLQLGAKTLLLGDVVRVSQLRGKFKVLKIRDDDSIDLYGGSKGREKFRCFPVERIKI